MELKCVESLRRLAKVANSVNFKKLLRLHLKASVNVIENSIRFQIFSILVNILKFHLKKMKFLSGSEDLDNQNLVSNI